MQNQGLGGFPGPAMQAMKAPALVLPGPLGLAYQGLEIGKKGGSVLIAAGSQLRSASSTVTLPLSVQKGDLIIVCGTLLSSTTNFAMGGANGGSWNSDVVSFGYFQWKVLTDTKPFTVTTNSASDTISWAAFRGPTQYARRGILSNAGTDSFSGGLAKSAASKAVVIAFASITATSDAATIKPGGVFSVATALNGASFCSYIDFAPSGSYPNGTTIKCPSGGASNSNALLIELT